MAAKDLGRLDARHRAALNAFARKHGRTWRSKLLALRAKGGYGIEGELVHAVNIVGPSGIRAYKVTVANPGRKAKARRVANPRGTPKDAAERWTIRRERLDNGGYTSSGRYFGRGAPLFVYDGELPGYGENWDGSPKVRYIHDYVRASDRASAIAKVLREYPTAKFYGVKKVANPSRLVAKPKTGALAYSVKVDGKTISGGRYRSLASAKEVFRDLQRRYPGRAEMFRGTESYYDWDVHDARRMKSTRKKHHSKAR
jgi:hypothetical protein